MPPNTNLFTGVYSRLPPPHKAHSYIQTAGGVWERGSSKERERERERTADDRVIRADVA